MFKIIYYIAKLPEFKYFKYGLVFVCNILNTCIRILELFEY